MLIKGVPNSIIDACEGLGDDSKTSQFNLTRVTLVINLKNGHKKYLSKIPFKSSCSGQHVNWGSQPWLPIHALQDDRITSQDNEPINHRLGLVKVITPTGGGGA